MDESPDATGVARRSIGEAGEEAAGRWLVRSGLTIVARGFRSRFGEIDLVAREGSVVVFVEVKTRTGDRFGRPAEAVTRAKRARLTRTAAIFLARFGWNDLPCRFDVVEMQPRGERWHVTHIPDAFRPGD
jgi:putative endonuclease